MPSFAAGVMAGFAIAAFLVPGFSRALESLPEHDEASRAISDLLRLKDVVKAFIGPLRQWVIIGGMTLVSAVSEVAILVSASLAKAAFKRLNVDNVTLGMLLTPKKQWKAGLLTLAGLVCGSLTVMLKVPSWTEVAAAADVPVCHPQRSIWGSHVCEPDPSSFWSSWSRFDVRDLWSSEASSLGPGHSLKLDEGEWIVNATRLVWHGTRIAVQDAFGQLQSGQGVPHGTANPVYLLLIQFVPAILAFGMSQHPTVTMAGKAMATVSHALVGLLAIPSTYQLVTLSWKVALKQSSTEALLVQADSFMSLEALVLYLWGRVVIQAAAAVLESGELHESIVELFFTCYRWIDTTAGDVRNSKNQKVTPITAALVVVGRMLVVSPPVYLFWHAVSLRLMASQSRHWRLLLFPAAAMGVRLIVSSFKSFYRGLLASARTMSTASHSKNLQKSQSFVVAGTGLFTAVELIIDLFVVANAWLPTLLSIPVLATAVADVFAGEDIAIKITLPATSSLLLLVPTYLSAYARSVCVTEIRVLILYGREEPFDALEKLICHLNPLRQVALARGVTINWEDPRLRVESLAVRPALHPRDR